jgi:hypothetical protein
MIYTAPDILPQSFPLRSVFIAGGISNCPDWQSEICSMIRTDKFDVVNPRRETEFDRTGATAEQQITWEHNALLLVDDYIFWFPQETLCPITLFELGTVLERLRHETGKFILVGWHPGYQRGFDLQVQIELALGTSYNLLHAGPGWDDFAGAIKRYYGI